MREQAAEIPFFRSLLEGPRPCSAHVLPTPPADWSAHAGCDSSEPATGEAAKPFNIYTGTSRTSGAFNDGTHKSPGLPRTP